ncbi:hypothetical protein [Comamonas sp. JC664]|uniref:hypothetical protein n=1 Tax=Comamonas sp. JC664 TaxID=2801917 RepID=UPI00174DB86C|nr:hypothetical protein [Comamonas sp. JC664]MBL0697838.1 hypothetical protein [Comamonas sp. JC664]GHG69875.1 hypothetical protein GCM10012319_14340 [Comamonas sp. KCTC 72670]
MRLASLTGCLLLWCLVGCSRGFSSRELGVQYEPPSGMGFRSVEAGPPARALFEGGLELRSVRGVPPEVAAGAEAVLAAAGLSLPGTLLQDSEGTLPAGPVARYEFSQANGARTLVYFVPGKDDFVLVLFSAPERDYGALSARVERSLSTLRRL